MITTKKRTIRCYSCNTPYISNKKAANFGVTTNYFKHRELELCANCKIRRQRSVEYKKRLDKDRQKMFQTYNAFPRGD